MKLIDSLRAAFLLLFLAASVVAETPSEWTDKYLREKVKDDAPGVAVLIGRDGQVLFQGGYGLADVEKKTPITPETKFRIGSVTKQFTAAAILKLAEEGKLAITDSLAKYFPELPNAQKITLRHLLTHTSGLHSFTDRPDLMVNVTKPTTPADLIAALKTDKPDFEPGTSFRYSNSGYFVLAEIVAKVSGKSYSDYLQTTFFEPLGLKDTGIYVNATPPPGAAKGYAMTDGHASPAEDWDMSWAGGAGAIYSTVGDLFYWTEALHGGRVVNAESLKGMTTPNPLPPGVDGLLYGYGLGTAQISRLPVIGHTGGLPGWSSNLDWLPQQKVTVVVLDNSVPPAPGTAPGAVTVLLVKHFLADDIAKLPAPGEDKTIDPKTFADYVGRYDYRQAILKVTVEKDHLYAQLTGQNKFEIFAQSPDEFFWKITDAEVHFIRNDKKEVVAAEHTQNGNSFRALRLGGPQLTPEQLDAFVGKYAYGPFAIMTIKREDDLLFAQLTGQPALPIFPTADDTFEWHIVKASVHFVKGDDGKVNKVVHTQGGKTIDAPRLQESDPQK